LLFAPELLDVEVLSMLRRAVLTGRLDGRRAVAALEDLVDWPVERIPHRTLVATAWGLRTNLSAYDAFYVAAAQQSGATLMTADGPMARAPKLGVAVHNIRIT
jgi:predicted nucleic acid-binding protein